MVTPQVLQESRNHLKSSTAAQDAAKAAIETEKAELRLKKAMLSKAKVDLKIVRAELGQKARDAHAGTHPDEGDRSHRNSGPEKHQD